MIESVPVMAGTTGDVVCQPEGSLASLALRVIKIHSSCQVQDSLRTYDLLSNVVIELHQLLPHLDLFQPLLSLDLLQPQQQP